MLKLNNNELSKIEFLDNLKNLKDLDLSCNKIRQIGDLPTRSNGLKPVSILSGNRK